MSTYFNDIQQALDVRASTISTSLPIVYENDGYEQVADTDHIRANHLFGDSGQLSMGDSGKDLTDGIYQLTVFRKKGGGRASDLDVIADHFKRGTILTLNDSVIRVRRVSLSRVIFDTNFSQSPISVYWQVISNARV